MRGALLRSGKSGAFTALGETGQPVYRSALQLREAIRRKNPGMAMHLAVPQSDELGDNIDWYSDVQGDVVPWGSATETERAPARVQLETFKAFLAEQSTTLLSEGASSPLSDKAVFAKLLTRVISFPDESFVYLVNGTPVLTFWGFVHPNADRFLDPLYCLYPRTEVPVAAPLAAVAEPVVTPPRAHVVVKRPWWRWLWWLLPLLLLLLLLFGLRFCAPNAPLPETSGSAWQWPKVELPQSLKLIMGKLGLGDGNGLSGQGPGRGGAQLPKTGSDTAPLPAPKPGGDAPAPPAPEPNPTPEPPSPEPPAPEPAPEPVPEPTPAPPPIPEKGSDKPEVPGPPLSIPSEAADGQADFLNGRFRAGAGIQDKTTGKPLRLEYQFKDGKGEVVVRKPDGISCTGPVTAAMHGGNLSINSLGQAACGDGSRYEMPKVDCRQGAKSIADCSGIYEDKQFPISMRQMGE